MKAIETRHIVTSVVSIPITKMEGKSAVYQYATTPGMGVMERYSAKDGYKNPVVYDNHDKTQLLRCNPDYCVCLHTKDDTFVTLYAKEGVRRKDIPKQEDVDAIFIKSVEGIRFWAQGSIQLFTSHDRNGLIDSYRLSSEKDTPEEWETALLFEDLYLPDKADIDDTYRVNIPGTVEYQEEMVRLALEKPPIASTTKTDGIGKNVLATVKSTSFLTQEEIRFFEDTVAKVKYATSVPVPIEIMDHWQLPQPNKEAIGICWAEQDETGKWVPFRITIDELFVKECFFVRDAPKEKPFEESLKEVIAHELAHLCYWRHGKKHTELAQRICRAIEEGKPCFVPEPQAFTMVPTILPTPPQSDSLLTVATFGKKDATKTLYFEGAGWSEATVSEATVGNCWIRTAFHLDDGQSVYLEIRGIERTKYNTPALCKWQYTGFVSTCYYITDDVPNDDANKHNIRVISPDALQDNSWAEKWTFEYTEAEILRFVNSLGASFDAIQVLPDLGGYQVFFGERPGQGREGYCYGDEFSYAPELVARREAVYRYYREQERKEKERVNFSLWVDKSDPGVLHLLRHLFDISRNQVHNKHWLIWVDKGNTLEDWLATAKEAPLY